MTMEYKIVRQQYQLREWRNDAEKPVNRGAVAVPISGLSLAESEEIDWMYPSFHFWVDPGRFPHTMRGNELNLVGAFTARRCRSHNLRVNPFYHIKTKPPSPLNHYTT